MPLTDGVPLMVTVLAVVFTLLITPAGNPETVAPVALPPNVYSILLIVVPWHTVWFVDPIVNVRVGGGVTVIVPLAVASGGQLPPVVVTV